ncbi:MAG: hypothetical protein K2N94_00765 [Lachnospiraceae bacterium]|nr:hypothetical protein [Lachnospiraceae bacterium]
MDRQKQAGFREQTDRLEQMRLRREAVREQKDMREVLAGYGVAIRGRTCRCPFHNDKNASAKVFRDGLHCFAEGRSYDVFDAVMHFEGCSFAGALEKLSGGSLTWEEWMQSRRVLTKRRQEQERRRLAAQRWKQQAAKVRALREEERALEPFSERWCRAANALPYAVYLLEALQEDELREEKV